ncbi:hypothetical protein FrEUN1fDRAFT_7166 [Parafrankia sp. EUN1f]|nr:hypothetical protein FrEUN1fDRAFT_7166 [Parafrankia sp. EUN1f]
MVSAAISSLRPETQEKVMGGNAAKLCRIQRTSDSHQYEPPRHRLDIASARCMTLT